MRTAVLIRKLHKWGGVLAALPLLVIVASGLLLQFKKDAAWIQPPPVAGAGGAPSISFARILETARSVPEAGISGWDDIERLDVHPDKGMVKVRGRNLQEVQIDTRTGDILHVACRRSDLIEDIHDGSFFSGIAKLWIFLPAGAILLGLWATGLYIFLLPYLRRAR